MSEDVRQPDDDSPHSVEEARRELVAALEGVGRPDRAEAEPEQGALVKTGGAGVSLKLRLNGTTIPLAGKEVNEIAAADLDGFVRERAGEIEAGQHDDAIRRALAEPGTGKVVARVRGLGTEG